MMKADEGISFGKYTTDRIRKFLGEHEEEKAYNVAYQCYVIAKALELNDLATKAARVCKAIKEIILKSRLEFEL